MRKTFNSLEPFGAPAYTHLYNLQLPLLMFTKILEASNISKWTKHFPNETQWTSYSKFFILKPQLQQIKYVRKHSSKFYMGVTFLSLLDVLLPYMLRTQTSSNILPVVLLSYQRLLVPNKSIYSISYANLALLMIFYFSYLDIKILLSAIIQNPTRRVCLLAVRCSITKQWNSPYAPTTETSEQNFNMYT